MVASSTMLAIFVDLLRKDYCDVEFDKDSLG